jgi:hypothetical protein
LRADGLIRWRRRWFEHSFGYGHGVGWSIPIRWSCHANSPVKLLTARRFACANTRTRQEAIARFPKRAMKTHTSAVVQSTRRLAMNIAVDRNSTRPNETLLDTPISSLTR